MQKKKNKEQKQDNQKLQKIQQYFVSVPFEYVTLENHETISYRIFNKNQKNTIVFIHGNMSGQRLWDPLFPYLLQNEKYTYITIDLRGCGRSTNNVRIDKLEDFADDIKGVLDELDIKKCIFVGWSMGGGIGMIYAIKYPQMIQKLVLLGSIHYDGHPPFKELDPETQEMRRITDIHTIEEKSKRINKNIIEKDREFLKIFYGSTLVKSKKQWLGDPKTIEIIFKETFMQRNYIDAVTAQHFLDLQEQMHLIQCPVLIYHGDTDVLISIEKAKDNAHIIRRSIGKDNCILIVKKQCGHAIPYEYPKDFARTLLTFASLSFKQPKPKF